MPENKLTIRQQLARIEKSVSLTGALETIRKKEGLKEVLSPNEFLIKTYMDEEIDIETRIKAAQAAKKDNKEKDTSPGVTVNVNNSSESQPPVTFDLEDM
jgi:hypothetical protein